MTSKSPARSCEDIDETALSYAEVKALATGDPRIKEKMDLDITVSKLKLLKSNYLSQKYRMEDDITKNYPMQIQRSKLKMETLQKDIQTIKTYGEKFEMILGNRTTTEKDVAGQYIMDCYKQLKGRETLLIGQYKGLEMSVYMEEYYYMQLKGENKYIIQLGSDALGNISRINHKITALPLLFNESKQQMETLQNQMVNAKKELEKPFSYENELAEKEKRLHELNAALDMNDQEPEKEKPDCNFIDQKENFEMTL